NQEVLSKAVYAMGRIAENEGELDAAVGYYERYVKSYSTYDNFESALMSLVLLYVDRSDWDAALKPLERLIKEQSKLEVAQRSTGALSFALYWAGRVYIEKRM